MLLTKIVRLEIKKQLEEINLSQQVQDNQAEWKKHSKAIQDHSIQIERYLAAIEGILRELIDVVRKK